MAKKKLKKRVVKKKKVVRKKTKSLADSRSEYYRGIPGNSTLVRTSDNTELNIPNEFAGLKAQLEAAGTLEKKETMQAIDWVYLALVIVGGSAVGYIAGTLVP